MALIVVGAPATASAQGPAPLPSEVIAREESGYARLIFKFPKPIKYERTIANGVLVLSLDSPVDLDLSGLALSVPSYIVAARSDPGGDILRFALAQRLTVSVLPAAERLFVDLLPADWKGSPPALPAEVVAELAERAAEAERAKRRARNGVSTLSSVPLTLRVGRYPTFSRVVFEWNDAVETTLSRSANTVKIKFNRPGETDLTRLNVDPPPNVRGARMATEDGRTEVEIDVAIGADVRGFREATSYVLDISTDDGLGLDEIDVVSGGQIASGLPPVPTADEEIRLNGTPDLSARDAGVDEQPSNSEQNDVVEELAAPAPEIPNERDATSFASSSVGPDGTATPSPPESDLQISVSPLVIGEGGVPPPRVPQINDAEDTESVAAAQQPLTAPEEFQEPAESQTDGQTVSADPPLGDVTKIDLDAADDSSAADSGNTGRDAGSATRSIFDETETSADGADFMPIVPARSKVEAKVVGETLRITLPFGEPVSGAVFQRANTLWMVFDTDMPVDVDAIAREGADRVDDVRAVVSGKMQIIRVKLKRRYLATANPGRREWVVSVGDLVLDPTTPIALKRALRTDGRSKVVANVPDNGNVHWLSDSEIGDQLVVVTAFGPARGLIKRQEFVEFIALPTAHGLAIQPVADDLAVRIAYSDVVVTRDSGLTVSNGKWPAYTPDRKSTGDGTRPGFVNFEEWRRGGKQDYRAHMSRLQTAISRLEPSRRVGARLELARLLISHDLGAEALGVMRLSISEDPEVENDPVFRAMRGVAKIMMGHLDEAERDFAVHGLANDPHSDLWRGLIAARKGEWRTAQLAFEEGQQALNSYSPVQQARFRLAGARAALMLNDLETATRHIDATPLRDLAAGQLREAHLLRAELAQALGETEQALTFFRQIESGPWGRPAAEARLNRINLELQNRALTIDDAIDQLETLAVTWRGDDVELAALHKLANLHAEKGNFQRALEVMRTAVITHNGEKRSRQIHEEMTQLFERLFLEEGADEMQALKALSLYYEFRELTPVGRRGDEMIRKLARRLIEVDLLGQAAELLNHQSENRLTGAARAQVAADLALVYLMDHKPELALRAIRRTRQAVLPLTLQQKRNTLEARSLAELGRVEIAIELLNSMEGADVEELKADALWRGKRWQAAGEQIEDMLGEDWRDDEPLGDQARFNVMRAGISYALAEDKPSLERLRRKFISKMASSPDSVRFDVVTKLGERGTIEFNTLAAELAEIETLSTFIDNFRQRFGEPGSEPIGETSEVDAANDPALNG